MLYRYKMAYMIGLVKVLTDSLRPNENHNIWSNSEELAVTLIITKTGSR